MRSARSRSAKESNPREVALRVLLAGGGQAQLDAALRGIELTARDRALLTQLVYGTLKTQRALDWSLKRLLTRPIEKLSPELHWILRLGAYQLIYLDKVPAHSAVDESVKLARRTGHAGTAAVANAVLRKVAAAKLRPPLPAAGDSPSVLADYASLPDWLAEHFELRFGFDVALRICDGINRMPRRAARVNTRIATVQEMTAGLERAGITVRPSRYGISSCLVLEATPPGSSVVLQRLIGSGRLTMQSEESQLAVHLLDPRDEETVLDVCAGRGIKTGSIGERSRAKVFALDDDVTKLTVLQQDMVRLGLDTVEVARVDATKPYPEALPSGFDAVFVDAPCTGIGTVGRRADLRWAKNATDPTRLALVQRAILQRAALAVRPGGRLLYVTCSTDALEDENVVDEFLAANSGWRSVALEFGAPDGTLRCIGDYALTIPGIDGADGFFYAKLRKDM